VMFYQSLVSDWNHGNAHFLRGVASELIARGHEVRIFEPKDGWSRSNLVAEHGEAAVRSFEMAFPRLRSTEYELGRLDLEGALAGADLVLVHEWNEPALVGRLGEFRAFQKSFKLLFHDTHHRALTSPAEIAGFDLSHYDGVLAYGRVLRDTYLRKRWARRAWIWHEAADARVFYPRMRPGTEKTAPVGDVVWIGNWGDEERTAELEEFFIGPVRELGLKARVYGVRYPEEGRRALERAGIEYCGWIPNHRVPEIFAGFRATVHVPRRPYAQALPGIPTIRVFEALACGIPLVSAPWQDAERLFTPGRDYLVAHNGAEMKRELARLISDPWMARDLGARGRRTILARHTCEHRVDELLAIYEELCGGAGRARRVVA
jgi:spore maturation protein CgeB